VNASTFPLTFLVAFPSAGDATCADDDGESGAFIPCAFFLLLNGIAGDEQKLWISLLHGISLALVVI